MQNRYLSENVRSYSFNDNDEIHYILSLLGHLIICRKNYKDVLVYDMQDMSEPIVTLLESKTEES